MKKQRLLPTAVFAVLLLAVSGGQLIAAGSHEGSINTNSDGIAIDGYDPVAYFTLGEATEGQSEISYDWGGSRWYFATAEHRSLFAADPDQYAPAYGGYCAWAIAEDKVAGIDPHAWHIEDDRLYLNYSQRINRRFLDDLSGNIERAEQNWPAIRAQLEAAADSTYGG